MFRRSLGALFGALSLALPVHAQGSDACASAQPISGAGSFPFDSTTATTDGLPDPSCDNAGQDNIENDVWFAWTPSMDGSYTFATCGTAFDTKVAVYDGLACPTAAPLGCNDDACGLQSELMVSGLVAGAPYLVRVGSYTLGTVGPGTLNIQGNFPVLNPANGHYYQAIGAADIDWDSARMAAESMTFMGQSGTLATITDAAENDFVYTMLSGSGQLPEYWLGGFQDTAAPDYSEPAGGWSWVTGEPWGYTQWGPGEPNDAPVGENWLIYLPTTIGGPGDWNDALVNHFPGGPKGYVVEFGGGFGTRFCVGAMNSTGAGGVINAMGSLVAVDRDVTLETTNLPNNVPGLYFFGPTQIQVPFGDGFRCAGGQTRRIFPPVTSPGGTATRTLNFNQAYAGAITAGAGFAFQLWYRDVAAGMAGFNLSDGIFVTFQ